MGAAVAPAAATAFGAPAASAAVYSSLAASAALPTVASMAAGPLASAGSSMMLSQSLLSPATALRMAGGGGLLGGLNTAFSAIKPYMSLINAGSTLLQGYSAYRTGQAQSAMYKIQAMEMQAKKETMKLNTLRESNLAYRKYLQAQSSAIAYGAAGGVNPFSGSALLAQTVGGKRLGVDIQTLDYNNTIGQTFADAQRNMLTVAGDTALKGSYYDGLSSIGQAIYTYEKTRTPT